MTIGAVEQDVVERPTCWCCGNTFADAELTRLGSHPEVGICPGCAHWLWRRARGGQDQDRRGPGVLLSRVVDAARTRVVRAGAQDWPLVGRLLRRLDRHLP